MVEIIKRLFPGSKSQGRGKCRFPNTKRNAENLNWIMLRYPLRIADEQAWEESYRAAVDHAMRMRDFNKRPGKIVPPPDFVGTLKEFQKEGLSYLVGTERALLADEMGLGKTIDTRKKMSQSLKGLPSPMLGKRHAKETRERMSKAKKGHKNSNWKGGKTEKIRKFRRSKEYVAWVKAVLERAGYKCEECGRDQNVEAHHKISLYEDFKEKDWRKKK